MYHAGFKRRAALTDRDSTHAGEASRSRRWHALRALGRHRLLRFLAVGALNTAFGYGCFTLLVLLGLHYSLALLLGTVLGVLFNFKTTGSLVFGSRDNRLLFRFVGTYAIIYCCNLAAMAMLVRTGLSPQLAGALLLLPMALLAFVLNRQLVFTSK